MKQQFDLYDIAWSFKQYDYLVDENDKIYESTAKNTDPHFIQQNSTLPRWPQLSIYRVVAKESSKIKCNKVLRTKKLTGHKYNKLRQNNNDYGNL